MATEESIMEIGNVERAIRWQAEHCFRNNAPCTGRLLLGLVPLIESGLHIGEKMRNWPGLTLEDAMPLRIAGGFHNLHLTGADDRLGPIYRGELTDQDRVDEVVLAVARDHDAALLPWLNGPPQTNEAGRSGGVMAGLLWLSGRIGPRFSLFELGSSAGINTMLDRFGFDLGGVQAGIADSPMQIRPEWRGPPPPCNPVEIVSVRGCDVAPIDLLDPAQALRLKSYVWPEVPGRLARIDAAVALASRQRPDVVRADAAAFVAEVLAEEPPKGTARVLFHSIVWQYLPPATRDAITAAMEAAGARATADSPLAWIKVETNRETFRHEIRARYWAGTAQDGEDTLLGSVHAHGAWLEWFGEG